MSLTADGPLASGPSPARRQENNAATAADRDRCRPTLWRAFRAGALQPPFARGLPGTHAWLSQPEGEPSPGQLFRLNLRRFLLLHALGQHRCWRPRIPRSAHEILWLHLSDHVGDSLMRLSSIALLEGRGVDLCASPKAAALFEPGRAFRQVESLDDATPPPCTGQRYDCLIIDALHTRPLLLKRRLHPRVPFVTLHDFFHYCRDDYNLTLFAWYRMAYLLGLRIPAAELAAGARLTLDCAGVGRNLPGELGLRGDEIALALGGREGYRIYRHWPLVARMILERLPGQRLVLVGSDNADGPAGDIRAALPGQVIDCVNRLSLKETALVLRHCALLACADGGLLHVANAVGCPTVGLFARELPEFRYVARDRYRALRGEDDVDAVDPARVAQEIVRLRREVVPERDAGGGAR